jgi:hypothetical protein
MLPRTADRRS